MTSAEQTLSFTLGRCVLVFYFELVRDVECDETESVLA